MIEIPLTKPVVEGGQLAPVRALDLGTKGLQAAGKVADIFTAAGDKIMETKAKLNRIESEKKMRQMKHDLRMITLEKQNEFINDDAPGTWVQRHDQAIQEYLGQAQEGITEEDHAMMTAWASNYRQEQGLMIDRDATTRRLKDSLMNLDSVVSTYQARGMFDEADEAIAESGVLTTAQRKKLLSENGNRRLAFDIQDTLNSLQQGEDIGDEPLRQASLARLRELKPAAEADKIEAASNRRVMLTSVKALIDANPMKMAPLLDNTDQFIKNYPGVTLDDMPNLQTLADTKIKEVYSDEFDRFANMMASPNPPTIDQIPEKFPKLEPRHHDTMRDLWRKRNAAQAQARLLDPKEISDRIDRIGGALEAMTGGAKFPGDNTGVSRDTWINAYSEAKHEIELLPDSLQKTRFEEKLAALKTGRTEEQREIIKKAEAAVASNLPAEPTAPAPLSIPKILDMPWASDEETLKSIGLTKSDAESFIKAKTNDDKIQALRKAMNPDDPSWFEKTWDKITFWNEIQYSKLNENAPEDLQIYVASLLRGRPFPEAVEPERINEYRDAIYNRSRFQAASMNYILKNLEADPKRNPHDLMDDWLSSDEAEKYTPRLFDDE